tara:strand:+ start:281 stop:577 length:297 start_codon:yes stop_codon:yes gene_type:complete
MLKNSFFKLNRNKKFNYRPRYLKEKKEALSFILDSRIKGSRDDIISNDRSSFWQQERIRKRIKENRSFNKVFIIILFFLFFIFFYIIDFDFSIFIKHR